MLAQLRIRRTQSVEITHIMKEKAHFILFLRTYCTRSSLSFIRLQSHCNCDILSLPPYSRCLYMSVVTVASWWLFVPWTKQYTLTCGVWLSCCRLFSCSCWILIWCSCSRSSAKDLHPCAESRVVVFAVLGHLHVRKLLVIHRQQNKISLTNNE